MSGRESFVFVVDRTIYYKFLGPVMDEALRRGARVTALHHYDEALRGGLKAMYFPVLGHAPSFRHGRADARMFASHAELPRCLREAGADAVFSLHPPARYGLDDAVLAGIRWVTVQHHADSFLEGHDLGGADRFCAYATSWIDAYLRDADADGEDARALRSAVAVTGFPELDQLGWLDPQETRRKYAIPAGRPVILYVALDHPSLYPIPGRARRLWFRHLFAEESGRLDGWLAGVRRRLGTSELAVVGALRDLARRQGAWLVVKSRAKRPIAERLAALADAVLYDETYYPATMIELLQLAHLAAHFSSTVVSEAVAARCHPLCVTVPGLENSFEVYQARFWGDDYAAFIAPPGLSTTLPTDEMQATLSRSGLADFAIDPAERERYVRRFFTYDDAGASGRVLDAAAR